MKPRTKQVDLFMARTWAAIANLTAAFDGSMDDGKRNEIVKVVLAALQQEREAIAAEMEREADETIWGVPSSLPQRLAARVRARGKA